MGGTHEIPVQRWTEAGVALGVDNLADESVIEVAINGERISTLLATSCDLEDLARGYLASEYGLFEFASPPSFCIQNMPHAIHVDMLVQDPPVLQSRDGIVTSSCGACRVSDELQMIEISSAVDEPSESVAIESFLEGLNAMRGQQSMFALTGGSHAAGLMFDTTTQPLVREDVGRHNAVDKVLGAMLREQGRKKPVALLISGRCGWDIVAKAAVFGIPYIVSVGAATSLAAKTARQCNMTLVTFVDNGKAVMIGPVARRLSQSIE